MLNSMVYYKTHFTHWIIIVHGFTLINADLNIFVRENPRRTAGTQSADFFIYA